MKNKYNIGDKVFYIEDNRVCRKRITGIFLEKSDFLEKKTIFYSFQESRFYHSWIEEKYINPSKEELLASL